MRKIDTASLNKRLLKEITELKDMVDKISPENVKYFDSDLIKSANDYTAILKDSTWSDNSNFNGIEMSKIRQMISYLKRNRKKLLIKRNFENIKGGSTPVYSTKINVDAYAVGNTTFNVPEGYDARSSFVYPRIVVVDKINSEPAVYRKRYLSNTEILIQSNGCASGEYEVAQDTFGNSYIIKTNMLQGNYAELQVMKNRESFTVSYYINQLGTVVTTNGSYAVYESAAVAIYLDLIYLLWK